MASLKQFYCMRMSKVGTFEEVNGLGVSGRNGRVYVLKIL